MSRGSSRIHAGVFGTAADVQITGRPESLRKVCSTFESLLVEVYLLLQPLFCTSLSLVKGMKPYGDACFVTGKSCDAHVYFRINGSALLFLEHFF